MPEGLELSAIGAILADHSLVCGSALQSISTLISGVGGTVGAGVSAFAGVAVPIKILSGLLTGIFGTGGGEAGLSSSKVVIGSTMGAISFSWVTRTSVETIDGLIHSDGTGVMVGDTGGADVVVVVIFSDDIFVVFLAWNTESMRKSWNPMSVFFRDTR